MRSSTRHRVTENVRIENIHISAIVTSFSMFNKHKIYPNWLHYGKWTKGQTDEIVQRQTEHVHTASKHHVWKPFRNNYHFWRKTLAICVIWPIDKNMDTWEISHGVRVSEWHQNQCNIRHTHKCASFNTIIIIIIQNETNKKIFCT